MICMHTYIYLCVYICMYIFVYMHILTRVIEEEFLESPQRPCNLCWNFSCLKQSEWSGKGMSDEVTNDQVLKVIQGF